MYGLVLAGGGAKGAYQIGAMKALEEMGLLNKISGVSGTSIGGVNLALFSSGSIENSEKLWKSFKAVDFLMPDDTGFDLRKEGDGFFSREALLKILDESVDYDEITNGAIPYYVTVCYKNENGNISHEYVKLNGMSRDEIRTSLMATTAIPLVYDAVEFRGKKCFDGGLKDNTPIKPLADEGIDDIIVISNDCNYRTSADKWPGKNIWDIVPSASLDMNTITGTADLDPKHELVRLRLGYLDAKVIIGAHMNNLSIPDLTGNITVAMQELKLAKMQERASSNMNKISNLLGKYGVEL